MNEVLIDITERTEDASCPENVVLRVAAKDVDGTVLSKGKFTLTHSSYGETNIKTLLAGGIATPVEYRRGGNVRKIFDYMHSFAAEVGAAVALLHPFSFSYYRKFAYERVADHVIARFQTRMLDFAERKCEFVRYDSSKLSDVQKIYREFAKGRNLLLPRNDEKRYTKDGWETYIYYEGTEPAAYVVFSTSKKMAVNNYTETLLSVRELAYTSPAALGKIFSFLRMFEGEFDEIEIYDVSLCPEVDMMLKHYTHTSYTVVPDISARVLNTEKLLSSNTYPKREGEFTVKIVDKLPSTEGIYRVSYGGGDCRVTRLCENASVDAVLTAPAFVQLVYGYHSLDARNAKYIDGFEICSDCEELFRAFPKKPCGIFEHF